MNQSEQEYINQPQEHVCFSFVTRQEEIKAHIFAGKKVSMYFFFYRSLQSIAMDQWCNVRLLQTRLQLSACTSIGLSVRKLAKVVSGLQECSPVPSQSIENYRSVCDGEDGACSLLIHRSLQQVTCYTLNHGSPTCGPPGVAELQDP